MVSMDNIYVHKIRRRDELPVNFGKFNTKAVVFINNRNDYYLSYQRTISLGDTTFPVVLLKSEDGDKVIAHLQKHCSTSIGVSVDEGQTPPRYYSCEHNDLPIRL